jgi:hypothetical protein
MHPLAIVYRIWTATKAAVISVVMILLGAGIAYVAWIALQLGLSWFDWNSELTAGSNLVALACLALAVAAGAYGVDKIFQALPGITPRRINEAGGHSRLANRKEKRRGGVV